MRRTSILLLTSACLYIGWLTAAPPAAPNTSAKLPAAATILDRYVQVTGGAQLYRRYGFVTIHSTVRQDDGTTFYTTLFQSRDGRMQTEIEADAASRESGVGNGIVWTFSEKKGARILSGKAAERGLAIARGLGEDDWRRLFPVAVTAGEQVINGRNCYRVKLTLADKSTLERFYDEHSGLLVRELSTEFDEAGTEQPVTTDYEDYQSSLGILHAATIHVKTAGHTLTIHVSGVLYSVTQPREAFEIPHEVARAAAERRTSGQLPNPVDLVDKFIEVTGGKDAYQTIKTEITKAEVSLKDQNVTFPVVVYAAPGKMYSSFDLPSIGKFEYGNNGSIAWEKSVVLGPRLQARSPVGGLLGPGADEILQWTDAALNMETLSKQEVNGSPCYQVSMDGSHSPQPTSTACFDVQTGYLVRTTLAANGKAGAVIEETIFSDYRPEEKFKTAHHLETKVDGKSVSIDFKEITINGPMPEGIFEPPADVKALAQRRQEQQKKDAAVERPTLKRPNQ